MDFIIPSWSKKAVKVEIKEPLVGIEKITSKVEEKNYKKKKKKTINQLFHLKKNNGK